jgi:hypothetical protein
MAPTAIGRTLHQSTWRSLAQPVAPGTAGAYGPAVTVTWWFVYAAGLLLYAGAFVVPAARSEPDCRVTVGTALQLSGVWAPGAAVLGLVLLSMVAGVATDGLLATVAVWGSAAGVSLLATVLVASRHNARLDRTGGVAPRR